MRNKTSLIIVLLTFVVASISSASAATMDEALINKLKAEIDGNANASAAVKTFINEKLLPLCTNEIFVQQVNEQNAKNTSLDEIKKIDEQWMNAEEELPVMEQALGNACADEIIRITRSVSAIKEAFVMDNKGAVVGENNLTSDYWQGDEPKWTSSYNNGNGGVDIGKEKLDNSVNAVIQQISLPIIDGDGTVIGAITFGIDVGAL